MAQLTKMQQKIYDYIVQAIQDQGYPPSVREIGEAVGLKSPSTVHFHLKHMEELGVLTKGAGKGRALTLAQPMQGEMPDGAPVQEEAAPAADRIPVVGSVAAGSPILAEECIEDYLTFDTGGREGEYFALRVRGESMLNAGILPDDLVVVHRQPTAHNGEIVVALLGDEATVKRLKRQGREVWLLPENPAYQPIDGREARILGKVAAVIRPAVDLLAGIPSVVYGLVGMLVLVPGIRQVFHIPDGSGLLAAIIVLAIMILPSIINVAMTALEAVPREYEDASLALGATATETWFKVSVPAARSGIAAAVVLGVGRAIGEAMAVMMVSGNVPNMPSLFQSVRFLTTAVASEMGYAAAGLQRQALFSIALALFLFIMLINAALNFFLKRSKEK